MISPGEHENKLLVAQYVLYTHPFTPAYLSYLISMPLSITYTHRDPFSSSIHTHTHTHYRRYAWDANAFPGNEYWVNNLAASGESSDKQQTRPYLVDQHHPLPHPSLVTSKLTSDPPLSKESSAASYPSTPFAFTGDPAAAACSIIPLVQNPDFNKVCAALPFTHHLRTHWRVRPYV